MASSMCRNCGERFGQYAGLCSLCRHVVLRREARERLAEERAQVERIERQIFQPPPVVPRQPIRTVEIGGVEFDVMWDGSRRSAPSAVLVETD